MTGAIPVDNNLAERSIRPFAIGRKNWLFCDTQAGAKANATMYSIIESAKANNLNLWKYINYILRELSQLDNLTDENVLEKYLPWSESLPDEVKNTCELTDEDVKEKFQKIPVSKKA